MTTNKIPQEIEKKILKEMKKDGWVIGKNPIFGSNNKYVLKEAISLAFQEGQKQNVDDVLKLIDELKNRVESEKWDYDDKYMSVDIQRSRVVGWIEELKAQIKNGGNDGKED